MVSVALFKTFKGRNYMPFHIDANINLSEGAQILALTGASGAGKTSVLRMIAGLLHPDRGRIDINGEIWFDSEKNISIPVQKRKVGFVFQNYALFPHMSVKQNIAFAYSNGHTDNKLQEYLELTGLTDFINHKPGALSGGQQQRVALVRALVRDPSILLLDEPLSALDEDNRERMQDLLKVIFQQLGIPVVLVSHSTNEVEKLADVVAILKNGKTVSPPSSE